MQFATAPTYAALAQTRAPAEAYGALFGIIGLVDPGRAVRLPVVEGQHRLGYQALRPRGCCGGGRRGPPLGAALAEGARGGLGSLPRPTAATGPADHRAAA